MKKTLSLFQRNYDGDRLVRDEVVPGAEWVAAGEGVATRKFDGTCCMVRDRALFKRYDCKRGKVPPDGFEPAQDADPETGHWPGWLLVGNGPDDARHREAYEAVDCNLSDGTYELCGPKVQGNPEGYVAHVLIRHGGRLDIQSSQATTNHGTQFSVLFPKERASTPTPKPQAVAA